MIMSLGDLAAAEPLLQTYKQIDPLIRGIICSGDCFTSSTVSTSPLLNNIGATMKLILKIRMAQFFYAFVLTYEKKLDEAFAIIDRLANTAPDNVLAKFGLLLKYGLLKEKEKALGMITPDFAEDVPKGLSLVMVCRRRACSRRCAGGIHGLAGERGEQGFFNYPELNRDPYLDNLRGEERFKKLMERAKYEWEHFEV